MTCDTRECAFTARKLSEPIRTFQRSFKQHDIGVVILADHRIDYSIYASIKEVCQDTSTRVLIAPDIFGSIGYLFNELSPQPAFQEKPPEEISFVCQYCLTRFAHQGGEESCQTMRDHAVPEIQPKVPSNHNTSKGVQPKL